jgi:CubicO group peptidase (beta-lactamase class C family)
MRKIIITALLTLCLGNAIAQNKITSIQEKIEAIDKELSTVIEKSKAAGFAIAIVKGKEIIYAKGFGYSDLENKIPVTPNTVFAIGSTTKAFTASLMGILEDEGKVDLDESPRTYIPELHFFNSEMDAQITMKDLMTHLTGLPRHDGSWKSFGNDSKEELLTRIAFQEPIAPVRSKWVYNNFMYFVQGAIVERLTEQSWRHNIEQNFFKPLEMTNSNTNLDALKKNPQAAIGYYFDDGINAEIDYYDIAAMEAAGSINSSVTDMSKWMMAWLNNGEYNGTQVIPSAYV